jgi:predicted ATPase/class 3 adenylate cyclase/DNA-binding CsgD family transcriptional regulator
MDKSDWADGWSDELMTDLPTGIVTLLLADVQGSTRLWETQPDEMAEAVSSMETVVAKLVEVHDGVRPLEQGEGDSFVIAFRRPADAVACALALQLAPLAPIKLRIGVHSGEVQLRDAANYAGTTVNRTARLRDLAHGGQTVVSGIVEALVADTLPPDAWLTDLGTHPLRDLHRPERVAQLCHPDTHNDFPALRTSEVQVAHKLPLQLTSFVGRTAQIEEVSRLLKDSRLVTLTGAGGTGKTRLALRVLAGFESAQFVELASVTDPALVPSTVARVLGAPDRPGRSTIDTLVDAIADKPMLVLLDNCEHLLDASAAVIIDVLRKCPGLRILVTSREPIGAPGEVIWRVPSLSLDDEAVELFIDRATTARADFTVTAGAIATVTEICRRLDGVPLAIELAAARVRSLSLGDILDGLQHRFRLLVSGSRSAAHRQQTLHASVDWSHNLLTEPERVLFRRCAIFMGGFDLDAAQAVCSGAPVERHQILDLLTLLVDKSLVSADTTSGPTRYRMLETVRQYALEKLVDSEEVLDLRGAHRDYFTDMAATISAPGTSDRTRRIEKADAEIDNLRAAFEWSLSNDDNALALQLASSLPPLWLARGLIHEGLSWFTAALEGDDSPEDPALAASRARAMADKVFLDASVRAAEGLRQAEGALMHAREFDDPELLLRALIACCSNSVFTTATADRYFDEAIGLARALGDKWHLAELLSWRAYAAIAGAGDPVTARTAGAEGLAIADEIGEGYVARACRCWGYGSALMLRGDLVAATEECAATAADSAAGKDPLHQTLALITGSHVLSRRGDTDAARTAAAAALQSAAGLGDLWVGQAHAAFAVAHLADGDVDAADEASRLASRMLAEHRHLASMNLNPIADIALARGDLDSARQSVDEVLPSMQGWHLATSLTTRARRRLQCGDHVDAEHDAHNALSVVAESGADGALPDIIDCLSLAAGAAGSHREAARLMGAAEAIRAQQGAVRYRVYEATHAAGISAARNALGDTNFEEATAQGATLSVQQIYAYARRGRDQRKRPPNGWASLTPAELDIVNLVCEGLGNKEIAARSFVSARTVQAHLSHIYAKLGITSRVQLVKEAANHS